MEEPAAWGAAQTACEQQGGNLASVDMSYDQAFIAGAVLQGKTDAWIGLRRKVPLGRENEQKGYERPLKVGVQRYLTFRV